MWAAAKGIGCRHCAYASEYQCKVCVWGGGGGDFYTTFSYWEVFSYIAFRIGLGLAKFVSQREQLVAQTPRGTLQELIVATLLTVFILVLTMVNCVVNNLFNFP